MLSFWAQSQNLEVLARFKVMFIAVGILRLRAE